MPDARTFAARLATHRLDRRVLLRGAAAFGLAACLPGAARAADFPTRPIRLVCPFPPGVSTDVLARAFAKEMSQDLGQAVVVENRPGANGVLASNLVAKAPGDGYTLLFTTGSHIANAAMSSSLQYRALDDFTPLFLAAQSYGLALISAKYDSVPAIVAAAKAAPGKLTYATSGVGNVTHVAGAVFEKLAGIDLTDVPYNSPTLVPDVIGGQVDMTFISTVTAVPLMKTGKVKVLATTGTMRPPTLPDAPTFQQLGYKDFDITGYFGMMAPADLSPHIATILFRALKKAGETKEVRDLLADSSLYPSDLDRQGFEAFLRKDLGYQTTLMQDLGIKLQ
ncbi:Bug family tripartite tricarboxylate transporter substrate binding protein [Aquabacter spiritensis]|uniref:Tripartite-type tricarboxylate transporter receptor subunit TctC n=1 Tax=Aquabacter spiritensis TaxID=933073 RepID=A0A4R3M8S3_9HYPH|nr:tripartite tricarboxylate transporter substrate binding protein [Aquabacter spiritensis]TCT08067.1 tripartite-type tricarboxylate transporter receptor subunit TctC [Aquabacter spiritensis]